MRPIERRARRVLRKVIVIAAREILRGRVPFFGWDIERMRRGEELH